MYSILTLMILGVLPLRMTEVMRDSMLKRFEYALYMRDVIWVEVFSPEVLPYTRWTVSAATEEGNEDVCRYVWGFPSDDECAPVDSLDAQVEKIMLFVRPLFNIGELRWFSIEAPKITGEGWMLRIYLEDQIWRIPID